MAKFVILTKDKTFYPKLYLAYWHSRYSNSEVEVKRINFFTAIPNHGAGIGHQLANWISGYWHAKEFGLNYAHSSFSSDEWEKFLGFGIGEVLADDLLKSGYRKVRLPLFEEGDQERISLLKKIITSYNDQKVLFVAEQDQPYAEQFGVINDIQSKFYSAPARKEDRLIYNPSHYNIAIHIRRGDIAVGRKNKSTNLKMRWLDNGYYERILKQLLQEIGQDKPVSVYIFSQGNEKDFLEFEKYPELHYCLDMSAKDAFLHLVFADVLITSKSSFSYKPVLLSKGIKICPRNFWHGYPEGIDWILANEDGILLKKSIQEVKFNK